MYSLAWIRDKWSNPKEPIPAYETEDEWRLALWERLVDESGRLFFHACKHAADSADKDATVARELDRWLDQSDEVAQEILHFERDTLHHQHDVCQVFRAHLMLSQAVIDLVRDPSADPGPSLKRIAQETGCQYGLLRDLMLEMQPGRPRSTASETELPVLLVDRDAEEGIVVRLTLEIVPDGRRHLYPASHLAFTRLDPQFTDATEAARACVLDLWPQDSDVRWRLAPRDRRLPRLLQGDSVGGAFALGLAKLFAS